MTMLVSLPTPLIDILTMKTFYPKIWLQKQHSLTILGLQLKDVVNVSFSWIMLEHFNETMDIWRVQFDELILDVFKLVALEDLHDATIVFIEQVFTRRKIEIYN